ncbi:MAG: hypothetical protein HOP11_13080 [Saprospiraceae bacterium]|nr:hypothetical protein [Saprospiraceae bacterium]
MFRNKGLLIVVYVFLFSQINAQINVKELCTLHSSINEASGIISINSGKTYWIINDSGTKPNLYEVDTLCNILRTVEIINANNVDWEDVCADKNGNLYIGDFGNNSNNRKDQRIIKVLKTDLDTTQQVGAQTIRFNYSEQVDFPPSANMLNFDMEAMVWMENQLHLFSKNRTSPFSGYTYHYVVPDSVGTYTVSRVDSFKTGPGPSILFWVTGAAISPDESQLCLLSHDKIWLFHPLNKKNLFQSPVKTISLSHFSQKEAIAYADNGSLIIADEINLTLNNGGNLYSLSIDKILNTDKLSFFQKPSVVYYIKEFIDLELGPKDVVEIFSIEGKRVQSENGSDSGRLNVGNLGRGLYYFTIRSGQLLKRNMFFKE